MGVLMKRSVPESGSYYLKLCTKVKKERNAVLANGKQVRRHWKAPYEMLDRQSDQLVDVIYEKI